MNGVDVDVSIDCTCNCLSMLSQYKPKCVLIETRFSDLLVAVWIPHLAFKEFQTLFDTFVRLDNVFTVSRIANSLLSGCRRSVLSRKGMLSYVKQTDGTTAWPTSSAGPLGIERRMTRGKRRACFWCTSIPLAYSTHLILLSFFSLLFTSRKLEARHFWLHRSKLG